MRLNVLHPGSDIPLDLYEDFDLHHVDDHSIEEENEVEHTPDDNFKLHAHKIKLILAGFGFLSTKPDWIIKVYSYAMPLLLGFVIPLYRMLNVECSFPHLGRALNIADGFGVVMVWICWGWTTFQIRKPSPLSHLLVVRYKGKEEPLWSPQAAAQYSAIIAGLSQWMLLLSIPLVVLHTVSYSYFVIHLSLWRFSDPSIVGWKAGMIHILIIASSLYCQTLFLLPCALFRSGCQLVLLRISGFSQSIIQSSHREDNHHHHHHLGAMVTLHQYTSLGELLQVVSHRYRLIIVLSALVTLLETMSGIYFLLFDLIHHDERRQRGAGREDYEFSGWEALFLSLRTILPTVVHLVGVITIVRSAAIITHRSRDLVSLVARIHAHITCASRKGSLDLEAFYKRHSLIMYLKSDHRLGLTLYGFRMDREFIRSWHMVLLSGLLFLTTLSLNPPPPPQGG